IFKALALYLTFNFILSLIYFVSPYVYFDLRSFWTFGKDAKRMVEFSHMTRFTGIMSDPNNLSATICAVASFILKMSRPRLLVGISIILMSGVVVASTMSATGAICYMILLVGYVLGSR